MIRYIKHYFSLKYVEFAFTDIVNGRPVNYYQDCYGDKWMKHNKWELFRCKARS